MSTLSPVVRIVLVIVGWAVWIYPAFVPGGKSSEQADKVDSRARWGVGLVMLGYMFLFTHGPRFWSSNLEVWRAVAGAVLALGAIALFRSATRNLGRQWRIEAGLNQDHALIQTGPYRVVRHPIYASMLGMFLAGICWVGTLPGWPIGLVLFIAGTEVRIRVEDGLLQGRFGERFTEWQRSLPAYVPFVR